MEEPDDENPDEEDAHTPAHEITDAIVNAANLNRLSGIPSGTANRLLFWSGAQ